MASAAAATSEAAAARPKIHPTAAEVARLGAVAHEIPVIGTETCGFMTLLGDEEHGRHETLIPKCVDIPISSEKLGGGALITSVTRFWANTNKDDEGDAVPPKGLVVWCHGAGHHSRDGVVFRWATELASRGYAMVSFDCEGNGCSSGLHGLCVSFDRWSVQAVEALAFARASVAEEFGSDAASRKQLPAILMGESMGGALAINTALEHPSAWDGIVLLAPMCAISPELMPNWFVVQSLKAMACCCPGWAVVPMEDHLVHCFRNRPKALLAAAHKDPLRYVGTNRLGTGLQSLNVMDKIARRASEVTLPMLIMHGSSDIVTHPETSLAFWDTCRSVDKTYVSIDTAWHVLWFDHYDHRVLVLEMVDEWMSQRVEVAAADSGAAAGKDDGDGTKLTEVALLAAPRILEARGSTTTEVVEPGAIPVPPGGVKQTWWKMASDAVEEDGAASSAAAAAAASPEGESGDGEAGEDTSGRGSDSPRLTIHLLQGPRLPALWADAPARRRFPSPDDLAALLEKDGAEGDGESEGEEGSPREPTLTEGDA